MTKTEHYQLNQWVPEDPVRREDFNEDNRNIENALVAHDEAVTAALKEHKAEVTAALETHKSETDAALSARDARITAVETAARFFHLAGPVTRTINDAQVTLDLSGVDLTPYRALVAFAHVGGRSGGSITCDEMSVSVKTGPAVVWFIQTDARVVIHGSSCVTIDSSVSVGGANWTGVPSLSQITRLDCSQGVMFLDLYGIKA